MLCLFSCLINKVTNYFTNLCQKAPSSFKYFHLCSFVCIKTADESLKLKWSLPEIYPISLIVNRLEYRRIKVLYGVSQQSLHEQVQLADLSHLPRAVRLIAYSLRWRCGQYASDSLYPTHPFRPFGLHLQGIW